jgi:hypothetical protein
MSLTNGLYNIMGSKNSAPPPYNKAARVVMTVEVETVQLRDEETDELLQTEKHYPYYPLVDRKVEQVGGGGGPGGAGPGDGDLTRPSPVRSRRSSNGSSNSKSSSASSRQSPSSWWGWGSPPSSDSDVGSTDPRQEDEKYEMLDGILEEDEANDEVVGGGSQVDSSSAASLPSATSLASRVTTASSTGSSPAGQKRMKFTSRPRSKLDNV